MEFGMWLLGPDRAEKHVGIHRARCPFPLQLQPNPPVSCPGRQNPPSNFSTSFFGRLVRSFILFPPCYILCFLVLALTKFQSIHAFLRRRDFSLPNGVKWCGREVGWNVSFEDNVLPSWLMCPSFLRTTKYGFSGSPLQFVKHHFGEE